MFFRFASSFVYPEELWVAVWLLEIRVACEFMEDISYFKDSMASSLRAKLRDAILLNPARDDGGNVIKVEDIVDEYLDKEIDTISEYLRDCDHRVRAPIAPDALALEECLQKSAHFYSYVRYAGKKASEKLERLRGKT